MKFADEVKAYTKSVRARKGRVGVYSVGFNHYWPQFPGLKVKLENHFKNFCDRLKRETDSEIIVYKTMCDCYETSHAAGVALSEQRLDLVYCFISTYSPSINATLVASALQNVPLILVCLQPSAAMDYSKATTEIQLENDCITSLPEINNAVLRIGRKPLDCMVGMLYDDEPSWTRIKSWCEVANVSHKIRNAHIGLMGHGFEGMYDMNSDPTMFTAHFGMHVEHISMDELAKHVESVSDEELREKVAEIKGSFEFPEPGSDPIAIKVEEEDIVWPARVAVGMEKLVMEYKLTGLSYFYRGLNNNLYERLYSGMIIGNSMLTSSGIAIAGELDTKNCTAMHILDAFGAGGSFAEIHPIDFKEDFVLVGHDGPHHIAIADGKPVLRKLKILHGKRGSGASVEFKLKVGPITMVGVTQTFDGRFRLVIAEGESLPGMIPATGNTNTRGRFEPDVRTFLTKWSLAGPTHHFALGLGHIATKIEMLASLLGIEAVTVTPRANRLAGRES